MQYPKFIAACAAVAVTTGAFVVGAPPAYGKSRPVVVVADPDRVVRRISYADLDLASAAGESTLHRRVGGAIRSLCTEAEGSPELSIDSKLADINCRRSAHEQAKPQVANAVQRARDIAVHGTSTIAATAISIVLPQ